VTIDIESLAAIDVHTHVHASVNAPAEAGKDREAFFAYFGSAVVSPTVPDLAEYYAARNMMCVAFTVDATTATGEPPDVSNDEIVELAARHPDVVVPFASIDPHRGPDGVREAERLVAGGGVRGFKFHPNLQAFFPNEREFYPLYEVIEASGLPALFHSGHTGGDGVRLKYSNPMFLDDVAVDFPGMPIILAHPSFPWQDEAISVALHKPSVYIDLSGWSPKYFAPNLVQYANTLLKHKVMFGSDYPVITPDRWLADFEKIDIRPDVRPLILKWNAARLLGLAPPEPA
jgi:predicted TIM-barrel fold metal-dependent hydrolase